MMLMQIVKTKVMMMKILLPLINIMTITTITIWLISHQDMTC